MANDTTAYVMCLQCYKALTDSVMLGPGRHLPPMTKYMGWGCLHAAVTKLCSVNFVGYGSEKPKTNQKHKRTYFTLHRFIQILNFWSLFCIRCTNSFLLQGALLSDPHQGFCPGTPILGSRSTCSPESAPPG